MTDKSKILNAHVQFELDRWAGAPLEEWVGQEVAALFGWLESVRLVDLLAAEQLEEWVQRLVAAAPPSEEFEHTIEQCFRVAFEALQDEELRASDLVPRQTYQQIVETIVGMRQIRPEVISQVTNSSVYSQFVAHVLYHGIKTYLGTENALARRIPGVGSLFKMGQHAVTSAAPGLEQSIDKRLISFIGANITETIRDSATFLNHLLDDTMMRAVADEIWAVNAERTVAATALLVSDSSFDDAVLVGRDVWRHLQRMPFVADVASHVVQKFFQMHGEKTVGALLLLLGIVPEVLTREVCSAAGPIVEHARRSGYLEARIRNRLDAFYAGYFAAETAQKPRTARRRPSAPREGVRDRPV